MLTKRTLLKLLGGIFLPMAPTLVFGENNMNKTIVVYFSRTGNVKGLSEKIANILNVPIYGIEAEVPYTLEDINWRNPTCRANREQEDPSARPKIKNRIDAINGADTIILGYPIWWGVAPKIISTLFETYDMSGKTIVPFVTSGSSGFGTSDASMKAICANATWKQGIRFPSNASEQRLSIWLKSQGVLK